MCDGTRGLRLGGIGTRALNARAIPRKPVSEFSVTRRLSLLASDRASGAPADCGVAGGAVELPRSRSPRNWPTAPITIFITALLTLRRSASESSQPTGRAVRDASGKRSAMRISGDTGAISSLMRITAGHQVLTLSPGYSGPNEIGAWPSRRNGRPVSRRAVSASTDTIRGSPVHVG
jgi:hypothetical protein